MLCTKEVTWATNTISEWETLKLKLLLMSVKLNMIATMKCKSKWLEWVT